MEKSTKTKPPIVLIIFFVALGSSSIVAKTSGAENTNASIEANAKEKQKAAAWTDLWKKIKFGTLWYLAYGYGEEDGNSYNKAYISRGYVTFKFKPVEWFEPRVTLDTHQDEEGDWKVRLKYMYGKFIVPIETSIITEPNIELGLVHGPWFDYEEHINNYRMEGTMFIERNGLLNSADAGFTVGGLIGKKLSKAYCEHVSSNYPGKYGSFALGLYNGGGYHAEEKNQNKVFMSRLSLRPLGFVIPNLQISHFFIFGKGNTPKQICDDNGDCISGEPNWLSNMLMASFEHEYFVLTAQYAMGKGNQKGTKVDAEGNAVDFQGFSVFGEIKIPWIYSSLMGRYDWFNWDTNGGEPATSRILAGYAFHFLKNNFALLSLDRVTFNQAGRESDWQVKLTLQINYPL